MHHARLPARLAGSLVLWLSIISAGFRSASAQTLAPGVTLIPVAPGYAYENLNAQSFVRHNLYTVGATQYIAFYGVNTNITLGWRLLGKTNWNWNATSFMPNSATDGHDTISIGISGDGILHCSWGMHGNPFNYARTFQPWSLNLVQTNMTGYESAVTYPQFINCPNGDLLYFFREGGSGAGNSYINHYSAATHSWTNVTLGTSQAPIIVGETGVAATTCNAYPNYECFDSHTNLVVSWTWRDSAVTIDFNHDTIYARSPDYGVTWQTWNGGPYTLPITETNADNVWPIATNHSIMNQSGQCLDTSGRPVICNWWAPLGAGTPIQYSIIWNDGMRWRTNQVGNRTTSENQTWPTRPMIVCDTNNWLWVFFTDPERGSVPTVAWTSDPGRAAWNFANLTSQFMGDRAGTVWGGWEFTYDPVLWQREGKLHILDQSIANATPVTEVSVLEFDPAVFLANLPPAPYQWQTNSGAWSGASNWTNLAAPPFNGSTNLTLNFVGNGFYSVTNDLPGTFALNGLYLNNTSAATNFIFGNPLTFAADGSVLPVLLQSGAASFQVGNSLAIANDLSVAVDGTGWLAFAGSLSGSGSLILSGGGTLAVLASNNFAGATVVNHGTLLVNGMLGPGAVTNSGGTLGGTGSLTGPVTILAGGILSPGNPAGTLTISNSLSLDYGSVASFGIGSSHACVAVTGNLTLGGALNVINLGGLSAGTNTLFAYGGTLSGSLALGALPPGFTFSLATNIPGQVNLVAVQSGSCIAGPYTADPGTLHLWHLDEASPPCLDSVTASNLDLSGLLNGAQLAIASYPGFGTCLNTLGIDGYNAWTNDEAAASSFSGAGLFSTTSASAPASMAYAGSNGAFTFECLMCPLFPVTANFGAVANGGTGRGMINWQILSGESTVSSNRIWQWRFDPIGVMTTAGVFPATGNALPQMDFINVDAGGTSYELFASIPTNGPNAIISNQWFHAAVTYSGTPNAAGNFKFYWTAMNPTNTSDNLILSTNLVKSLPGPGNQPSLAIGNEGRHDYSDWLGLMDEVRISSIARGPSGMMFTPFVDTTPTNLAATISGGTLVLNWPAGHTGWRLLVQTNHLAQGISSNSNDWGTVSGSANTNQVILNLGPAVPAEFYRLVYP
jgi:autotransporter-associated beta strand protein